MTKKASNKVKSDLWSLHFVYIKYLKKSFHGPPFSFRFRLHRPDPRQNAKKQPRSQRLGGGEGAAT